MLATLSEQPGRAVTHAELITRVWGTTYVGGSNVVDVVVRSLRRKLGPAANRVETARGVGYRLNSRGEEADDLGKGGGVLEDEEVAALVDVEGGAGDPQMMSSPFATGVSVVAPLATKVGQAMRPSRSTTSWWLRAASCSASPRASSGVWSASCPLDEVSTIIWSTGWRPATRG